MWKSLLSIAIFGLICCSVQGIPVPADDDSAETTSISYETKTEITVITGDLSTSKVIEGEEIKDSKTETTTKLETTTSADTLITEKETEPTHEEVSTSTTEEPSSSTTTTEASETTQAIVKEEKTEKSQPESDVADVPRREIVVEDAPETSSTTLSQTTAEVLIEESSTAESSMPDNPAAEVQEHVETTSSTTTEKPKGKETPRESTNFWDDVGDFFKKLFA